VSTRLPRPSRTGVGGPVEVLVLARACAFAGLIALATAAAPFSRSAPRGLALVLGLLGLALAAALWRARDRVPVAVQHAVVVTATVAVSACIAASTTPAGTAVTAFSYFWIGLYSAAFHRRRALVAHLLLLGAGFAVGLWWCSAVSPVQTWWFVMATVTGVAWTLHAHVDRLRRSAERDQLTGQLSRGAFAARAEQAMEVSSRSGLPLTLAVLDLDHFKAVNDHEGHAAGDRLLVELTGAWSGVVRRGDVLGRHGGDEFVLLMPGTTAADAGGVLERLRAAYPASWTAGVAQWSGEPLAAWVARADADLYEHKRARDLAAGHSLRGDWPGSVSSPPTVPSPRR
jgi:diguanylate cyclase (GGDEF)-like protein